MFTQMWETYALSFPAEERREIDLQRALFRHPRYRLLAWLKDEALIGLAAFWLYDGYRYLEHLAVTPELRSGGFGGAIVRACMAADPRPLYLEIDEPRDDISRRRLGFYSRLGFCLNPFEHLQPSYTGEDKHIPMRVLTWPTPIDTERYGLFLADLRRDAWAHIPK